MSNSTEAVKKSRFSPRHWLANLQCKISSCQYSYLAYCFIVPAVIMYLVYVAMGIHPFGDGTVLILDLNGQYVYFFEALRNIVYGEDSLLYTFLRGLGGEFIGMYAYYLASPLSYIVALFPQENILEALLTIILIKVGLCGTTFGFYLHKHTKNQNKVITVIFSVMYALCAYAVVYQNNIMWIDAIMWLPLIAYGIEQLIKNRRYKLFVIALALSVMSNFYIGYMTCIFVMLYYFYYCLAHGEKELNPHGERLHMLRSFIRIAAFSLLAVAISAFIILGAYYSLGFGKNEFSDPTWNFSAKFNILDFLTKFLPGSYDTVRPEGLPYVYCGVLTLLMLPVYFLAKKIPAREKIASLVLIGIFILSFIANPLDLIWHGFQSPNWLNYRYSFMLCFILLILAYKGFGNLRSASERFLLGISAFIILFVTICDKLEFKSYVETGEKLQALQTVWLTILAVIAIFAVLCLLLRQKNVFKRENLSSVLAIIVCIEIFCSSIACTTTHQADTGGYLYQAGYKNYTEFVGGLRPIVNEIKATDKGFYRMEKLVHRKVNDNMALGIMGVSNSTSTLNSETITYLKLMGYASRAHRSIYKGGTPVNDSLLGIKYIIDYNTSGTLNDRYEVALEEGSYKAYINPYALSLAYGVDSGIADFDIKKFSTHFDRLNSIVKAMLGDTEHENVFDAVPISDVEVTTNNCTVNRVGSVTYYAPIKDKGTPYITYTFTATESREYFFHTPAKIANATTLYVNGLNQGEYLGSDTNCIMSLGYYDKGDTVKVRLELGEKNIALYQYYSHIWSLNSEAFNSAFKTLKENPQFEISEFTNDNLIGKITTAKEAQTIQTTIPYDEGWKIYVDGKEIKPYKTMDALIAFDIDTAGEHSVELKYSPEIYRLGAIVSISGTAIFLLLCLLDVIMYFAVLKKRDSTRYSVINEPWVLEDFDADFEELAEASKKKKKSMRELFDFAIKKKDKDNNSKGDKN